MGIVRDVNIIFLVGLVISFLGFFVHVIGMATTRWSYRTDPDFEYGVFRYCIADTCKYYSNTDSDLEAAQAMTIMGAIASIITFTLACIHVSLIAFRRYYLGLAIASFIFSLVACVTIMMGVIVWVATCHERYRDVSSDYELGWSFIMSAGGGGLFIVSAILFLLGRD